MQGTHVTLAEARSVLGVDVDASPRSVREAFLRRVRANHPDVTDHPAGAAERTATIITAYRLLRDAPAAPPPASPIPASPEPRSAEAIVEVISEEAIWVGDEATIVGRALLEVADDLGEVSYVDRSGGLVQLTVRPPDGPTCWFTISTHARPGGTVLVATLESIEAEATPPAGPLVLTLAAAVATHLGQTGFFSHIT